MLKARNAAIPASATPTLVVVDVRDDDFAGGNIPSAINVPSQRLLSHDQKALDGLIEKTKGAEVVVFHCALSQVRSVVAGFLSFS